MQVRRRLESHTLELDNLKDRLRDLQQQVKECEAQIKSKTGVVKAADARIAALESHHDSSVASNGFLGSNTLKIRQG